MSRVKYCRATRAFTMTGLLVAVAIVSILLGLVTKTALWIMSQAEVATLVNRASNLSTALEIFRQNNHRFPDAYPAHLELDLASYIDDPDFFVNPSDPAAGVDSLNRSYVTPVKKDPNSFVLAFDRRHDKDSAVVLFANNRTEVVDKTPMKHNQENTEAGSRVTGGGVVFANGTVLQLSDITAGTLVLSFQTGDGSLFSVVKLDPGSPGFVTAVQAQADIIEIASDAGIAFLRAAAADIEIIPASGEHHMKVSSRAGEARIWGKPLERGKISTTTDGETGDLSSASSAVTGTGAWLSDPDHPATVSWDISMSPEGLWHYYYNFSVTNYDIGHVIIGTAGDFMSDDIMNQTGPVQIGMFGPGPSNPNMPCNIYGMKFDDVDGTAVSLEFDSWRAPQLGDFYAKGGRAGHLGWNTLWNAWNVDPSNRILVPGPADTTSPDLGTATAFVGGKTFVGAKQDIMIEGTALRTLTSGYYINRGSWVKVRRRP